MERHLVISEEQIVGENEYGGELILATITRSMDGRYQEDGKAFTIWRVSTPYVLNGADKPATSAPFKDHEKALQFARKLANMCMVHMEHREQVKLDKYEASEFIWDTYEDYK